MVMPSFFLRSMSRMTSWKWPLSPYKGNWKPTYSEIQVMQTLKKKVFEQHSPSAYPFIIKHLFQRQLLSQIPPILDHLEKAETFEVSERVFVNLIRSYDNAGMFQDSVDIFTRIPRFRYTPSVLSLNSLLLVLCKNKEVLALVQDILMKTPEMNICFEASSFRILIRALCRTGKVDCSVELLDIMHLNVCVPDAGLYSLVLHSFCKQAGSGEIMCFIEEMWNAGLFFSLAEYNGVINVFITEGKAYDACSILARMKSEGTSPDIMSYNIVFTGFVLENDLQKVDELFDEILLTGLVFPTFLLTIHT